MRLLPLFLFWCLWYINFSYRTAFSPILPLVEDSLALSHGAAAGFFTSLSIGYGMGMLSAGRFVSAWGYKRTVVLGFIFTGLIVFCLQWIEGHLAFYILFFFMGTGLGTYLPSILPVITGTYDPKHWGKAIGIHDSAASISIFSVPVLVTLGLRLFTWKGILLFLPIVSFLLLILFWRFATEPKKEKREEGHRLAELLRRRPVQMISLLWILPAASNLGVYTILSLYLVKERGMDFQLANSLLGISRIAGIVAPLSAGFLVDRYGYQRMLMWSLLLTGLSTVGLSLASSLPELVTALLLQATISLSFFPVALAAIARLTDLSDRSMVTGIAIAAGVFFGMGASPFVLGVIADHSSFRVGILGLGVLTAVSSLGIRFLKEA